MGLLKPQGNILVKYMWICCAFVNVHVFSDLQFPPVRVQITKTRIVICNQCFLSAGCCRQSSLPEETIGKLFSRWWLIRWLMLSKTRSFVRTFKKRIQED